MFLYIIRTPLLELKSVGEKCGLYTGKDGTFNCNANLLLYKYQYHRSNITIKVIVEIYDYFVYRSYSIENYTI